MEWTAIAEIAVGFSGILWGIIGYLYKQGTRKNEEEINKNTSLIDDLKSDLAGHKLYCAQNYVTNSELSQTVTDIKQALERTTNSMETLGREMRDVFMHIQSKLDSKADK